MEGRFPRPGVVSIVVDNVFHDFVARGLATGRGASSPGSGLRRCDQGVGVVLPDVAALDQVEGSLGVEIDRLRLIVIRIRRALRAKDVEVLLHEEDAFLLQLAHAGGLYLLEESLRRLLSQARLAALPHKRIVRGVRADVALDELADCLGRGDEAVARRAFGKYPFRLLNP